VEIIRDDILSDWLSLPLGEIIGVIDAWEILYVASLDSFRVVFNPKTRPYPCAAFKIQIALAFGVVMRGNWVCREEPE